MPAGQPVKPAPQLAVQPPGEQTWPGGQLVPQLTQWLASVWKLVQKPLGPLPQRLGAEAGQAQPPGVQTWPGEQTVPQAPQLFTSAWKLVQKAPAPLPQALGVEVGQAQAGVTPVQIWPCGQAVAQVPQLFTSLSSAAQ